MFKLDVQVSKALIDKDHSVGKEYKWPVGSAQVRFFPLPGVQGETFVKFEPASAALQSLEALSKSKVLSVVLPWSSHSDWQKYDAEDDTLNDDLRNQPFYYLGRESPPSTCSLHILGPHPPSHHQDGHICSQSRQQHWGRFQHEDASFRWRQGLLHQDFRLVTPPKPQDHSLQPVPKVNRKLCV